MDLASRASTLAPHRLGRAMLIVLLVLAVVGLAIVAIGSRQPRLPAPFGLARNGELDLECATATSAWPRSGRARQLAR